MKRKLISAFLCTIMSLSFAGCRFIDGFKEGAKEGFKDGVKKANNETTVEGKKDTTEGEFKVDWKKCIEDTKTELTNPEPRGNSRLYFLFKSNNFKDFKLFDNCYLRCIIFVWRLNTH